jgi:hypothetical protein
MITITDEALDQIRQVEGMILSNPEDTWDAYCAETPEDGRSPQGAMAFAIDRLSEVLPKIRQVMGENEKLRERLEFAEWEWNRATEGMKERDATIADLRSQLNR